MKPDHRALMEAAEQASNLAYCPYSHYPVGAAVLTFDDRIYTGCNIENCGLTQTIHAEQTAIANALSDGALERALASGLSQLEFVKAIAVFAQKNDSPWPCCNCRQSLNEFGLALEVITKDRQGRLLSKTLAELIPNAFPMELVLASVHGENWRQQGAASRPKQEPGADQAHGSAQTSTETANNNKGWGSSLKFQTIVSVAKEASQLAYCPYSKYAVGAAVLTFDGNIYSGCNIENCSYTQTIHAEQVAMAKAISDGALKRASAAGLSQFECIEAVAIYSPNSPEPWPSCNGRQSLSEFGLSINIVGESGNQIQSKTLKELIPFPFPLEAVLASIHQNQR